MIWPQKQEGGQGKFWGLGGKKRGCFQTTRGRHAPSPWQQPQIFIATARGRCPSLHSNVPSPPEATRGRQNIPKPRPPSLIDRKGAELIAQNCLISSRHAIRPLPPCDITQEVPPLHRRDFTSGSSAWWRPCCCGGKAPPPLPWGCGLRDPTPLCGRDFIVANGRVAGSKPRPFPEGDASKPVKLRLPR